MLRQPAQAAFAGPGSSGHATSGHATSGHATSGQGSRAGGDAARGAGRASGDLRRKRRDIWIIVGFMALAAALRAPFMWTGLSTDEGGYAYIAQEWSRGQRLYGMAWLDRPQGLLLTYRALLWVNDSGWTIRLGMVAAGVILTGCIAVIGWLLAGRRVGVVAAGVYAVVGVAPHLEGMTLNGELMASVPATAAVAAALWWRHTGARRWLLVAGLLAGLAITMKQSGIDGLVVGVVVVLLVAGSRADRWRRIGAFGGLFALPLAACALHGWSVGWSRYWTALAGYQFSAMGSSGNNLGTRWSDFTGSLGYAGWDLGALVVIGGYGFRYVSRPARWILGAWVVAGAIGINLGGSYWPHYYVQVLPPLAILAATTLVRLGRREVRVALAAALVLPGLVWLAALVPMSNAQRSRTIPYDALARRDDRIAAAIDAETTPADKIYVLESEAYLYFAAQRPASYRYLWGKPIQKIPDALPLMRGMLTAPGRPTLVILDTPDPAVVDPTGAVGRALSTYYHVDKVVDGVVILRKN